MLLTKYSSTFSHNLMVCEASNGSGSTFFLLISSHNRGSDILFISFHETHQLIKKKSFCLLSAACENKGSYPYRGNSVPLKRWTWLHCNFLIVESITWWSNSCNTSVVKLKQKNTLFLFNHLMHENSPQQFKIDTHRNYVIYQYQYKYKYKYIWICGEVLSWLRGEKFDESDLLFH